MPEHLRRSGRRPSPDDDRPPSVRDFTVDDLRTLRHDVTRFARASGLTDPVLYRFVLAIHELATNAVRHGGGHGRLELRRTRDQLCCQVSDHGPGMPPAQPRIRPAVDAPSGRGLWLAKHAGELTCTSGNHGTSVTLTCTISPPTTANDIQAEPQHGGVAGGGGQEGANVVDGGDDGV
ncbi:ATP-binding protein [Actinoplanes sp. NEAU-A12]|uniref:ATP-binding protein n=1 Tax=Actinoplanes sandaracinus TaxID=3045177 RepID=A0ABT6WG90_9ACTN|nr:ATP-binding protein [Actinoplanes sandaracinus]MDI6098745.1 ATP-binding protein [Actinoplanes sandaracinus]